MATRARPEPPAWMGDPTCPACGTRRHAVALASTVQSAHFRHPPNSGCALVHWERNGETEFDHDPAVIAAKKERAYRFESLEGVYLLCHCLFGKGNLPVAAFLDLLREADEREFWRLKGMETWNLGYRLALIRPRCRDSRGGPDFCFRMGGKPRPGKDREFLKVAADGGAVIARYPWALWKYLAEARRSDWLDGSKAREMIRAFAAEFRRARGRGGEPFVPVARDASGARPPTRAPGPMPWRRGPG